MSIKPYRYTLRKEYFGGLIHDAKTTMVELLTDSEFDFIASIINKNSSTTNNKQSRINEFVKKGYIIPVRNGQFITKEIRIIKPPKYIRNGILTAPIRIFDSYTQRCNFHCDQCYFSSSAFIKEERRTIVQTKDIIHKFYESGTMEWRFTGGEALIIPDLFEAIKEAKNYGMNVGINTNGWWGDSIAQKIFSSGIDEIVISLEGSRKINDKRRRTGGYDKVI